MFATLIRRESLGNSYNQEKEHNFSGQGLSAIAKSLVDSVSQKDETSPHRKLSEIATTIKVNTIPQQSFSEMAAIMNVSTSPQQSLSEMAAIMNVSSSTTDKNDIPTKSPNHEPTSEKKLSDV